MRHCDQSNCSETERFNSSQTGLPLPSCICFVHLQHPWRVFGGLYHCLKCGWNLCSSFDNMQFLIFCKLGWKCLFTTPIWAFLRNMTRVWPSEATALTEGEGFCLRIYSNNITVTHTTLTLHSFIIVRWTAGIASDLQQHAAQITQVCFLGEHWAQPKVYLGKTLSQNQKHKLSHTT